MKKEMVRRFTWPEILLHWGHAVLYLVLFCTGALLLAGRLSGQPILSPEILIKIHRVSGGLLVAFLAQTLLVSILARDFRCLWRTVVECLRWRWKDVLWLLKVPFNALTRRIVLPPAGRFNAGQKLHVLVVTIVLTGFSLSGLFMILVPGALAAWIVHVACFVPAAAFLALHLFLALVNPETRKSLPSIFSGRITREYARQHHGLWIGDVDSEHRGSYVSLAAVAIVACTLVAVLVAIGVRNRAIPGKRTVLTTIAQRGTNAICPAPLAAVHAGDMTDAGDCMECHSFSAAPGSAQCLECHDEIEARLAAQSGYHGKLTGPCRQCHQEHQGREASLIHLDRATFNHAGANFPLHGKHQSVPCENCHGAPSRAHAADRMQFIGLAYGSCTSCHTDPHQDERAGDCLRCHTMEGWGLNDLTFDHDRDSRFRLEGAHAALDCQECHPRDAKAGEVSVHLFDVGRACRDCHEDPHHGQFDGNCDRCHTEQGWKGRWLIPFHTADSRFPLRGRHATLSCERCHRIPEPAKGLAGATFAGLGHECRSCHADPHGGQMSLACNACHRETGWTENDLLFSHDRHTSFRLDRLHSVLACSACHGQEHRQYRPLPHECGDCHKTQQSAMKGISRTLQTPPDPHDGRLVCVDCHDTNDVKQSMSSYARRCAGCHNDAYGQLAYEWAQALQRRQTAAEQWMRSGDAVSRERIREDLSEAAGCGFHNFDLTRQLYDRILGTPPTGENGMVRSREDDTP